MKKRILSMLLMLCMVASLLPTTAFAAETEETPTEPGANPVYVAANASNENPAGTQDDPFKTVQAAYDAVGDGGTIYLLTDIEIAENDVIKFSGEKSVTLTSAGDETHRIYAKENLDLNQVDPYECLLVIGTHNKDAASNDNISGPTITLKNITLDGNNQNVRGIQHYGGTLVLDTGAKVCNASYVHPDHDCGPNDWGGGIVVDLGAKLVMNDGSEISSCAAEWGGGVYLSGVMEMNGGRICNNQAVGDEYTFSNGTERTANANGGGITVCAFRADLADEAGNPGVGAKLTINGGLITQNEATCEVNAFGGGICVLGSLYGFYNSNNPFTGTSEVNINGGTISNNSASHGAGIMAYARKSDYAGNAKISMTGGTISGNTATHYGGGVCLWSSAAGNTSEFHMSGGQITSNQALREDTWGDLTEGSGGGVSLYGEGDKFYMTDGAISDNQAGEGGGLTISSNGNGADAYLLGGTISGNKALDGYPTSQWFDGSKYKYEGNAVLQDGNLYLDGTSAEIDGDIRLPYEKGMGGQSDTNHVVTLVGAGENMNEYFLTSYQNESMDGRPVVVPGACSYEGKEYKVEDAEPYMEQFSHNWKGIIPGTKYTELMNDGEENAKSLVLYETYTVKYEYDGAVPENAPALPKTVNAWSGAEVSVAAAPIMNGWKFSGWTVKSPDGTTIQDGKLTMPSADVVLTGSWSPLYTVTYDLNGGDANGKDYSPATVDSGTEVTVKDAPVRDGYVFTGWSDGVSTYYPGDVLTVTGNITLTAQWRKTGGGGGESTTYYILHYESNGGTQYKDERYTKNTVVQLDKVPVREGYQFTGWYADKDLTERITSIKMTSDKTVYAGWRKATVPDMLNGDDHFAYVVGYPDGTVRPNANISRSEVAAIFFRLLKPEVRDGNLTSFNTFTDVNEGMWCNKSISTMAALNIVKGRSAERFDPDAPITRAEFAAICARFDTGMTKGDSNFTDISGHWAEAEIERAASLGWIMGYTDGTFRPDNYITRAEAMTMINRVLCRIPENEDDLLPGMNIWPDNQSGAWYYLAVQEATNSHDFQYKGEIYEHWIRLTTDPNWTRYQ